MWYDGLPGNSLVGLWSDYVRCGGDCHGIRKISVPCPACGSGPLDATPQTVILDGREIRVGAAFMGAEGRYEDYIVKRHPELPPLRHEELPPPSGL